MGLTGSPGDAEAITRECIIFEGGPKVKMAGERGGTSSFLLSHGSVLLNEARKESPFTNHLLSKSPPLFPRVQISPAEGKEKDTLLSKIIEERQSLNRSHRILMTERRRMHSRQNQSIDVSALLPVPDQRGRILEETISSEASDTARPTPTHHRILSQHDATTGMNLTLDQTSQPVRKPTTHRIPVPTCYLNDDCGLMQERVGPSGAGVRCRPMTEMRVLRGSGLERVKQKTGDGRPKSRVLSLDMDVRPQAILAWKQPKPPSHSSISYVEDLASRRQSPPPIITPQLKLKLKRDKKLQNEQIRRSLELHRKVVRMEQQMRTAENRSVFDVKEIVLWTSGSGMGGRADAGSPLLRG